MMSSFGESFLYRKHFKIKIGGLSMNRVTSVFGTVAVDDELSRTISSFSQDFLL